MIKTGNENPDTGNIKQLPYGVTDYGRIRQKNFYYIDKTSFIPGLEKAGSYLFFIRPRRFGKTLLMSMLSAYYDISYKDQFEEFFKGTAIYKNPTRERNSYFVLNFNFSQVDPAANKVENSFLRHVRGQANFFVKKYKKYFGKETGEFIKTIKTIDSAADILSELSRLCREYQMNIYVLIDEYDIFANTILSSSGTDAYYDFTRVSRQDRCEMSEMPSGSRRATEGAGGVLVVRRRNPTEHNAEDDGRYDIAVDRGERHGLHGEGFYRSFFNILKGGTSEMEAPFTRILLTGVSPITLDDVTSGYNIGENVSLDAAFNRMLGFSEAELVEMLDYFSAHGQLPADTGNIRAIIKEWYGNYLFSQYENEQERIYNPDMVFYFLKEYFKNQSVPKNLIDENVKVDYNKLRHLILVDKDNTKKTNGNFSRIKEIIEKGETFAQLIKAFPLAKLTNPDSFISLLFYFGLLTIDDAEQEPLKLTIPNETIRHLFYDYIVSVYQETGVFSLDLGKYKDLMTSLAYNGKWKALFDFVTGCMKESLSLRDLITGEKAIQAFLNVYLGLSNLYIIHPEREANKGYADIIMEPFLAQYPDIQYSYMIEIKYMKPGEAKAAAQPPSQAAPRPTSKTAAGKGNNPPGQEIQKLVAEAEDQLRQYSLDEKLSKILSKTTLIKIVLVFCGHEAVYIGGASAPRL